MEQTLAIHVQGLIKSYGRCKALHGVNLEVRQGELFGWGIAHALVCAYGLLLYDTLVKPEAQQQYMQLISNDPPVLVSFFGDMSQMFTPGGYLDTLFFSYIPIVTGFFLILSYASLIAGDEEKGILDLVLAHPISRFKLFFGRVGAFTAATILILFISWIDFVITLPTTSMDATIWELILPFLSLFSLLMFFGMLTILLSMLRPSQQWAAMTSGHILVASYFLSSLSKLSENLKPIEKYFPMHYYHGGQALTKMNWSWFGFLIGFSIIFAIFCIGIVRAPRYPCQWRKWMAHVRLTEAQVVELSEK
jgi:ABC-2 type transport system permease protein